MLLHSARSDVARRPTSNANRSRTAIKLGFSTLRTEILALVSRHGVTLQAVDASIATANAQGGRDNIGAILVRYVG